MQKCFWIALSSSRYKGSSFSYDAFHVSSLKKSGTNRTRLISTDLKLYTAHPATHPPIDHNGPIMNDLQIQEVHNDTDNDGDVETSTNQNYGFQVPNCESLNQGATMAVRQTENSRVVDEAKALISR